MAQKKTWIVKWMPDGDDIDGCKYFRGDTNRAYETFEEAEERAMHVANESRRFVGIFELVAAYRPPLNVEKVLITGTGKAEVKNKRTAKKR